MQQHAFTILEFCTAYRIGRSKFYELLKLGQGPRLMKVGRRVLVSTTAADEWARRMEQPQSRAAMSATQSDGC